MTDDPRPQAKVDAETWFKRVRQRWPKVMRRLHELEKEFDDE